MAGSTFGKILKVTTWGESHGKAVGAVVDGIPAGMELSEEFIQSFLNRRKPGQSKYATQRTEADEVKILSGIFENKTTGAPISLLVNNTDHHSADYSEIANIYRPGHADYTFDAKYGFRDYRGGGRSSGRETIGRVAAGAIASKFLYHLGILVTAYTKSICTAECDYENFDYDFMKSNELYMPDKEAYTKAVKLLDDARADGDSLGGIIECLITGMPAGIGEPVFDKLDARLAQGIFSIGAVKGFEIGDGFNTARMRGSQNNDAFVLDSAMKITKDTNHSGGILGGMSDGTPILFRAAVKPTPSISQPQTTVNKFGKEVTVNIKGRHDPVIVPRAVVVVETMAALTIADLVLENMGAKISNFDLKE